MKNLPPFFKPSPPWTTKTLRKRNKGLNFLFSLQIISWQRMIFVVMHLCECFISMTCYAKKSSTIIPPISSKSQILSFSSADPVYFLCILTDFFVLQSFAQVLVREPSQGWSARLHAAFKKLCSWKLNCSLLIHPCIASWNIYTLFSCGDGSLGEPPRQGEGQCGNMRLLLRQQQRVRYFRSFSYYCC